VVQDAEGDHSKFQLILTDIILVEEGTMTLAEAEIKVDSGKGNPVQEVYHRVIGSLNQKEELMISNLKAKSKVKDKGPYRGH
jgi:hypothetical protein